MRSDFTFSCNDNVVVVCLSCSTIATIAGEVEVPTILLQHGMTAAWKYFHVGQNSIRLEKS